MARAQSLQRLQDLFISQTVATLAEIQEALGAVSAMTAFRVLREVAYRRSYNCNGRYYAAFDLAQFDDLGLWGFQNILFSIDGSLKATVRRMVGEADRGLIHRELTERLQVRVHNTLLDLTRGGAIARQAVDGVFCYFASDPVQRAKQLEQRRPCGCAAPTSVCAPRVALSDAVVIAVLLALLRCPDASADQLGHRLRGHAPPISPQQVQAVFARYDLEALGEKGGSSRC